LTVAVFAALAFVICAFVHVPHVGRGLSGSVRLQPDQDRGGVRLQADERRSSTSFMTIVRIPAVADCVYGVIIAGATLSMLEPVIALQLQALGVNPGRIR